METVAKKFLRLVPFVRLIKFHYHVSFLGVIFAPLIFLKQLDWAVVWNYFCLYLSFNVLLYGGIYAVNDAVDVDSDRRHPIKRNRPVARGSMSVAAAVVFAIVLMILGLISGFVLFGAKMVLFYAGFILLNLIYSFFARNVPYLDLVANAATHPLRFWMGTSLLVVPTPSLHLAAFGLLALGLACLRRSIEMDVPGWRARITLKHYSRSELLGLQLLAFTAILLLFNFDRFVSKGFFSILVSTYLVLVFAAPMLDRGRVLLKGLWVN